MKCRWPWKDARVMTRHWRSMLASVLLSVNTVQAFMIAPPPHLSRPEVSRSALRMTTPGAQESSPSLLGHLSSLSVKDAAGAFVSPPAELLLVLSSIAAACKTIAHEVRRAGLTNSMGLYQGSGGQLGVNAGGEKQKKLDVISNDVMKEALSSCRHVSVIASEEEDGALELRSDGDFVVVYDPLDGSSNVDASIPTGTIFGIYRKSGSASSSVLQPGREQVAAGFCLYSAASLLVLALKGGGTHTYTLDTRMGEFRLTKPHVQIPKRGPFYSLNEARVEDWPTGLRKYITDMKRGDNEAQVPYDLVYVCSLVADAYFVMIRGGMACNPRSHLRLIYEGNPMALVVEEAGGLGSTGVGAILDVQPTKVHQRLPVFLGSELDIRELESYGVKHGGVQQLGDRVYAQ